MILTEEGFGVNVANTGKGALENFSQQGFDLLVADLRLPDMDGMNVIHWVKEKKPDTAVIVITGYSSVSSAVEAMREGAADFLPKPFTEEEFMARVTRALSFDIESLEEEHFEPSPDRAAKIGFYICRGGTDISDKIDVDAVVDFARNQPDIAVARSHKYLCRESGLQVIEEDIRKLGLNRVVVGACHSESYETNLKDVCRKTEMKPEHLQMVSMREQVAWATETKAEATAKAKSLAAAAVYRVTYERTRSSHEVPVHPDVLVVGGGIAGMQAALDIAESGHKAYLIEQKPTIGGHMLQFDKTFPTLDCAACIGTPKMVSVGHNPNIALHTYSEVMEVSGSVGHYRVKIRKRPRYIDLSRCTGCGDCVSTCPVRYKLYTPEEKRKKK
jgi:CheY-like chemotaxis protein/NAD-dependent dihydropyrimidine dehydrogenase PreA subunit